MARAPKHNMNPRRPASFVPQVGVPEPSLTSSHLLPTQRIPASSAVLYFPSSGCAFWSSSSSFSKAASTSAIVGVGATSTSGSGSGVVCSSSKHVTNVSGSLPCLLKRLAALQNVFATARQNYGYGLLLFNAPTAIQPVGAPPL